MIRPILSSLRAKNIINDEEEQALINGYAGSQNFDRETIETIADSASQKEAVVEALSALLREDVGEMQNIEPIQPVTEPQASAELVNDLLSSNSKEVE